MTKVSEQIAKSLAIEISKDVHYEEVYQAAIRQWTYEFLQYDLEQLRYDYEEKYDYLFEQ